MIEKTCLFNEIHEQPEILRQLIQKERGSIAVLAETIQQSDIT